MSNLVIKDLDVETVLDRKTMASVTGGFFMRILSPYRIAATLAGAQSGDKISVAWKDNSGETGGADSVMK